MLQKEHPYILLFVILLMASLPSVPYRFSNSAGASSSMPQTVNQPPKETHVNGEILKRLGAVSPDTSVSFSIRKVDATDFGGKSKEVKLVLHLIYEKELYYLALNKANLNWLTNHFISLDKLTGATINLYCDENVVFNTKVVGGVRIAKTSLQTSL